MAMGWEMHILVALNKIYWYMQISWLSGHLGSFQKGRETRRRAKGNDEALCQDDGGERNWEKGKNSHSGRAASYFLALGMCFFM